MSLSDVSLCTVQQERMLSMDKNTAECLHLIKLKRLLCNGKTARLLTSVG
jgi:hypothetical protein